MPNLPSEPPAPASPSPRIALRRIWALLRPYWVSEDRWPGRGLLTLVLALNLASVGLTVLLADWNRQFYDALQGKDAAQFLKLIGVFTGLAAVYIVVVVFALYFGQMLQIRWRRWLTDHYAQAWLTGRAYYLLQLAPSHAENPEQRIQDDINLVANLTLDLLTGLLNAVVTLASFLVMLWTLSGTLEFSVAGIALAIPGYMVWAAVVYAAFGSVATHLVGRPLIDINFALERANADFRFRMIRVRENAESIALYGGEADEADRLQASFGQIWQTWWRLMKAQRRLTFFTAGYAQAATIFPVLVAAPRFFAGAITLGGLTQTAFAFGQVQSSLSWLVDAYPRIAQWMASVNRLLGFEEELRRAALLPQAVGSIQVTPAAEPALAVEGLHLRLPDGRSLLEGISVRIGAGERVVVQGPSGSGKSTLFRALAGIWPFGTGTVTRPRDGRILFLPQRPYLPIGSLRQVLGYPDRAPDHSDAALAQALRDARLPHLIPRLDEEANWALTLSGGEQQRIGFARALLYRPAWLFLDEATSALDETTERAIYALIQERLPGATIISVAHRPGVAAFHRRRLVLRPETRTLADDLVPAAAG